MFRIYLLVLLLCHSYVHVYGQHNNSSASNDRAILQIGYTTSVFFNVNINDGRAVTKILTKKIAQEIGLLPETETTIFHDIASIEKAVNDQKIDLIIMLPTEYIELSNRIPLDPLVVPKAEGYTYDEYLLLVRQDRGVRQLGDLKGKKIIIETRGKGGIPLTWLDTILMRQGLPESKHFFHEVKHADKASQTVLPVFFSQADACVVGQILFDTMTELNPQIGKEIVQLECSPGVCFGIICCRKGFVEEYPGNLVKILTELHETP